MRGLGGQLLDDEAVMRALANEFRRRILHHLLTSGPSTYMDMMKASGLEDSGRFAYHLRRLVSAGLVQQRVDGRYCLTRKGLSVASMLSEEEKGEVPTVIETLDEFSKVHDVKGFMYGSVAVGSGLWFLVWGSILTALSLLNVPVAAEVLGTRYYFTVRLIPALAQLILGLTLLPLGLKVLGKGFPEASVLQLLMTQKYSTFLLIRSPHLKTYLALYGLVGAVFIALTWLALTP
ncbi:MAG: helix-turn-helix transcriptional regulator [Desulfurococcales archaeon]|nr:helix-turn-helix transcriptional regulator [Desulfurococcales archaeon]